MLSEQSDRNERRQMMGNITFLQAIGGYAGLVCVFAIFNLFYNFFTCKVELSLGVIGAHFLASAIAVIVFFIVFVLIFWIHRGAAWWIGCVAGTVIGTGVLSSMLSSQR